MGFFDDLFGGGGNNPADAAMPYYNKIPGMLQQYYNPYIQRGEAAFGQFNPILQRMLSDPAGYLNDTMKNYQPSQNYQYQLGQMTNAAGNSAAAGGMRGSQQDIQNSAHIADQLSGQDMQRWLGNVNGLQNQGLSGEMGLYDQGFKSSIGLADELSNVFGTEGSLAFQGQANQNQSRSDFLSALMKMAAGGAGWYMGGPAGAFATSQFFKGK